MKKRNKSKFIQYVIIITIFLLYSINGYSQLVIDAGVDQTICSGKTVVLGGSPTVTGGTAPYTYIWTPDVTIVQNDSTANPTAKPFNNTTYTVTVIDDLGITDNATVNITVNSSPVATAFPSSTTTICENVSLELGGQPTVETGTGTAPFTYNWIPSDELNGEELTESPLFTPIGSGNYPFLVQIEDINGCTGLSSVTVFVQEPSFIDVDPNTTECIADEFFSVHASIFNPSISDPGGVWSKNGSGTFENGTDTLTNYYPSHDDRLAGSVKLTYTSTDDDYCSASSDFMIVTFQDSIHVNAGADKNICFSDADVNISGTVSGTSTTGEWSTLGDGTFDNVSSLSTVYYPGANDISDGSFQLILSSTNNGVCSAVKDTLEITVKYAATANAGGNQTLCENNADASLSGIIGGDGTSGIWTSSSGKGTFTPDNTSLNAVFVPHADDLTAGSVILTLSSQGQEPCVAATDNLTLTFTGKPEVDGGLDQSKCFNDLDVTLNGNISVGSTEGTWTSSTGLGNFIDANDLGTVYTPDNADVVAGNVTLYLTSINNGNCNAEVDSMKISFINLTNIEAGTNETVCANKANVELSGSVTGGTTTGIWSSNGDGLFVPSPTILSAIYKPGGNDISSGLTTLTLTSTNTAPCTAITDSLTVTINGAPVVGTGGDQNACANDPDIALNGSITGPTTSGIWSTSGDGTFFPNNLDLSATYYPGTIDEILGTAALTLTSTNNGDCNSENESLTLTIGPAPIVNAGADEAKCSTDPNVTLNGSVTAGSTTGEWSTSGTGTFNPDATSLNATYVPSADDMISGSVSLFLTSTNNGNCIAETDNMVIDYTIAASVTAGSDTTLCGNNSDLVLTGTVTGGAGTGQWSTSGNGTFSPTDSSLSAIYYPGSGDKASGNVTLTLSSTNNGNCVVSSDNFNITITPSPVSNAGPDQYLSTFSPDVTLNGSVGGATTTGTWSSSGTGTFVPNATTLAGTYEPSTADTTARSVELFLYSTNNGNCNPDIDTVAISWSPGAVVLAGEDQDICITDPDIVLDGSVSVISTTGVWTSSGTGSFIDSSDLKTTYLFSAADITSGSVTFTLTSTNNVGYPPNSDIMVATIVDLPVANAGVDDTICANDQVLLDGDVTGGTTTGFWLTAGDGSFMPDSNDLFATYMPGPFDQSFGRVNLTLTSSNNRNCTADTDIKTLVLTSMPIVNANTDQVVCENNATINLNGSVTGATSTGNWSTAGDGTFVNSASLTTTYTLGSNDKSLSSVILILTSTNNGECLAETDDMELQILSKPLVSAGIDQTVCANNSNVVLNGVVGGITTSGSWSTSGTGSFSPNNTSLSATYIPSSVDTALGNINLVLSSTDNSYCNAERDTMQVTILTAPEVDAGIDQVVSTLAPNASLDGSVTGGGGTGIWSTFGTGTFVPNNTTLDGLYQSSAADTISGSALLVLTSTNNGNCIPDADSLNITYVQGIAVNAGEDASVCVNNTDYQLQGSVNGGTTTGTWTASGTGTFDNINDLQTIYHPSAIDIINKSVVLTLTSTNNGPWPAKTDQMTLTISDLPIVDAGLDESVCSNAGIVMNGYIGGGTTTGIWTTSGDGYFDPAANDINAEYVPGTVDKLSGTAILSLSSTNNGGCATANDNKQITILAAPAVDAGVDQVSCANNPNVTLNGGVSGGTTTGEWSTSGDGSFFPHISVQDAEYLPGANDIAGGSVVLTLHSTNNSVCNEVTDEMVLTIISTATVDAGEDQSVCANKAYALLTGSITGETTTGIWTTSGDGTFTPSANILNNTYIPGSDDIDNGSATLYLTSTNNNKCLEVNDQLGLTITSAPEVNAGVDVEASNYTPNTALNGSITGGSTTGIWSTSGSGSFVPGNTSLNATYYPSTADTTNKAVQLILISTNNGNCSAVRDTVNITYVNGPVTYAGEDQVLCETDPDVYLNGDVSGNTSTGEWSTSGTGAFNDKTDLNTIYHVSNNDRSLGSVVLYLTSTDNGSWAPKTDSIVVTILPLAVVDAGANGVICANKEITLNGLVSVGSTTGIWTTSGDGYFVPDDEDLNASYYAGPNDQSSGNVTLTLSSTNNGGCAAVSDNKSMVLSPMPLVDAGPDQIACKNNTEVDLAAMVNGVTTTGTWTTSGDGAFTPDVASLNATYQLGNSDISSGFITLTLTSTNNGTCEPETDNILISVIDPTFVFAGSDKDVCATAPDAVLNGAINGETTTGIWSSLGDGTFAPDNTTMNVTYSPGAADISNGLANIVLASTNNITCLPVYDTLDITILPEAIVDAGVDREISVLYPQFDLNGSVTGGSSTGVWSTSGSGSFFPNNSTLDATYQASIADTAAGTITLTLSSTNNGSCSPVTDDMVVTFLYGPVVNAGEDFSVCITNTDATLSGEVTGTTTTGIWTTAGSGSFDDNTVMNTVYHPSAADITGGTVVLTLTSTNNGSWAARSDDVILTIADVPVADAGANGNVCSNATITLNGAVTGGTSTGGWTTSGDGLFIPDTNILNAQYSPGTNDITNGTVDITLTSTNNGGCVPDQDVITLTIIDPATVNAGVDAISCANNAALTLGGSVSGITTTGIWTTAGDGTFAPSANNLNATYTPGSSDISNKSVNLTLHSTNNDICNEVTDKMELEITPAPSVNAGDDQNVCSSNNANLVGSVTGPTTSGSWTTSGDGTFTPNNITLNNEYVFGANDISNGTVTLTLTSTVNGSCIAVADNMNIVVSPEPIVDAGIDTAVCTSDADITLNGSVTSLSNKGEWTSTGSGSFSPDNSTLNAVYSASNGDFLNGTVSLELTALDIGNCLPTTDVRVVTYTKTAIVNAGNDIYVCSNDLIATLSGSVAGGTSTGQWSTLGTGTFDDMNDLGTNYNVSAADATNGTVELVLTSTNNAICDPVTDTVVVLISDPPTASAGINDTVCANNADVTLTGIIGGGTSTGIWTTPGDGIFTPSDSVLNTVYTPGSLDITNGSVLLTLTSTNNKGCAAVSDNMSISITPSPVVSAGGDQEVCETETSITLNGSVTGGATSGIWSTSGSGAIDPSNTDFNINYLRSVGDSISGTVNLILTSTGNTNGECLAETDTAVLTLSRIPVVNAGADKTVCTNNADVALSGSVSGGTSTGIWSTPGDGVFSPNDSLLSGSYISGTTDKSGGSIYLRLTSTNNGGCSPDMDSMLITYIQGPIVTINPGDTALCLSNPDLVLTGSVTGNTTTGKWTSSGTGSFVPNDSTLLGATYVPGASDIDTLSPTSVEIYLTSTNNGGCFAEDDTITVTYQPAPLVYAGIDRSICNTDLNIDVSGLVGVGTLAGVWSSTGTGSFVNDTALTTTYNASMADTASKLIYLILSSTNNGYCPATTDSVRVNFVELPSISAGENVTVCRNNISIALDGQITNDPDNISGNSWIWETTGSGDFSDITLRNPEYVPSTADMNAGNFYLILSSPKNVPCATAVDTTLVTISPSPVVDAGTDQSICIEGEILNVSLSGTVSGGTTTGIWTSSGDGSFPPGDTVLVSSYTLGTNDLQEESINLILTSTNNGSCLPETDSITLFILAQIDVDAGENTLICANNPALELNGSISGATTNGIWGTTGDGTFSPNESDLDAIYSVGPEDTTNHQVVLYLSSVNNQGCQTVSDSLTVNIIPAPILYAGEDTAIKNKVISLSATAYNTNKVYWKSSGLGEFEPSDSVLQVRYNFSPSEILSGDPTNLVLYTKADGLCIEETDTVYVRNIKKEIPNAFTPGDGDGINDIFMEGEQIAVYNRWGQLLFEGNEGWDGKYKGSLVSSGTYYYIVTYTDKNGNSKASNGSVTIVIRK